MNSINFIDYSKSVHVQRELGNLCSNLEKAGIRANWFDRVEKATVDMLLLVHDPVDELRIPKGCKVLGQRTLNRRERLVLAENCGLSVPRWRSLASQDDIKHLFKRWNVDNIIYKADWSYSRGGIRLLNRENFDAFNKFDPDGDVFMRILGGSPYTYKIDIFFDEVIACRKILTRSVFDNNFYRGFTGISSLAKFPPIVPGLKKLGRAVFDYGVGLTGVDVMFDVDGKPWVIELNTCSVGREANWRRWPESYINGYTRGLCRWVKEGCPAKYGDDVQAGLCNLINWSGGE